MLPKVSVVMSAYNEERYVGEAVDSILSQTFEDFELIVINDGSEDGTPQILRSYTDNRMRVFHQENRGLTLSLNRGIKISRGQYIARMDANDISIPQRLGKQVRFLDENPGIGMVGTAIFEIGERVREKRVAILPNSDRDIRQMVVKLGVPFVHPTVMFRRSALLKAGMYNTLFEGIEDMELFSRIMMHFEVANLLEPLVIVRRDWDGITARVYRNLSLRLSRILVNYKLSRRLVSDPRQYLYLIVRVISCLVPYPITEFLKECSLLTKFVNASQSGVKRSKLP